MNIWESVQLAKKQKENSDTNDIFSKADEIERLIMEDMGKNEEEKNSYYLLFRDYFLQNGAKEYAEWGTKLSEITRLESDLLVRRESPDKIASLVKNHEKLSIEFSKYGVEPNAAMLGNDLAGLRIALAGGFGKVGKGSVAFTVGFKGTSNLNVESLPKDEYTHFQGQERILTKMVNGEVPFEDVRFILMRMPKSFFPEKYMTDEEQDNENAKHIQRMFVFEQKKKDLAL